MRKKVESIVIRDNKLISLSRYHPWVFSGAIFRLPKFDDGTIVRLVDRKDNYIATGYYQNSSIAVRILDREDKDINQAFWNNRVNSAIALRKQLGLTENLDTNCFRIINGEGDGIPGLIADYYNGNVVIQSHTTGINTHLDSIKSALDENKSIAVKHYYHMDKSTDQTSKTGSEQAILVKESGIIFEVDPLQGQKTGLFLDQRLNRQLLGSYASGKKVLNLFCYTGAFSLYALRGGAVFVESIDISQFAIDSLASNIKHNKLNIEDRHLGRKMNIKKFLPDMKSDFYDLIIVDPPAYAKHRNKRHNAVNAYKRLNITAINKVKKGGIIFTFSCSQVVDTNLFEHTIRAAAIETGRTIKILHYLSQAPDHPTDIYHLEGRYLKGLVLHVN